MEDFSAGEFLQGFLEEAGEHLQRIHENLLSLEQVAAAMPEAGTPAEEAALAARADLLAELFRSFHTLKGLAGMVGLREAAELSHALEATLQAAQHNLLPVDQDLLDRLFDGSGTLAMVINSVKDPGVGLPDIRPALEELQLLSGAPVRTEGAGERREEPAAPDLPPAQPEAEAYGPSTPASVEALLPGLGVYPDLLRALADLEQQKVRAGLAAGQSFSIVVFASSAERAARGENVDLLRQHLNQVGTLIKAVPVMAEGVFRFLFLVSSPQPLEAGLPLADEVIPLIGDAPGPTAQSPALEPAAPIQRAADGGTRPAQAAGAAVHGPVVRVNLDRLDELMRLTGDLVRLRSRLGENLRQLQGVPAGQRRELNATVQMISRSLRDLRRAVLGARMVPLSEAFNRMPLVVRDLARASQKEVRLTVQGETNELDKLLVEKLLDPLIHLVRNAIIHGIEPPEERAAAGKPTTGSLTLRGIPEGDHVLVEVADDGRGIDLQRIAARAAALGLPVPEPLEAEQALELISAPGFSTHERADLGAGRGVGLDIVARMVRAFGGQLQMESRPGQGTLFRLRLPLTLVIVDVLLVRAGGERYAAPRDAVERIIEIDPASIARAESGELLPATIDGVDSYYVLHRLEDLLNNGSADGAATPEKLFGLVLPITSRYNASSGIGKPVLVVDQVIDIREVVVQTFTDPLVARPGVAGATELGDGSLAIILDIVSLLRNAHRPGLSPAAGAAGNGGVKG